MSIERRASAAAASCLEAAGVRRPPVPQRALIQEGTADTGPGSQRGHGMAAMVSHDILVPTDFGPGSRLALERAMRSLGPEGGTICVLHVLDQHLIAQMQALVPDLGETQLWARLRQQAEVHYANRVAGLARANVTAEPLIIKGIPFLKIVQ